MPAIGPLDRRGAGPERLEAQSEPDNTLYGSMSVQQIGDPYRAPRCYRRGRSQGGAARTSEARDRARARRRRASRRGSPAPVVHRRYSAPSRGGRAAAARHEGADRSRSGLERRESARRDRAPLCVRCAAERGENVEPVQAEVGDRAPPRRRVRHRAQGQGGRRSTASRGSRAESARRSLSPRARRPCGRESRQAAHHASPHRDALDGRERHERSARRAAGDRGAPSPIRRRSRARGTRMGICRGFDRKRRATRVTRCQGNTSSLRSARSGSTSDATTSPRPLR